MIEAIVLTLAALISPIVEEDHRVRFELPGARLRILALPIPKDDAPLDALTIEWAGLPAQVFKTKTGSTEAPTYLRATCKIGFDRRLTSCHVEDYRPQTDATRLALVKPLQALKVTGGFQRAKAAQVSEVIIGISASSPDVSGMGSLENCLDPFCTSTPAPPPPPHR